MLDLSGIVKKYCLLENEIQKFIDDVSYPLCSGCNNLCCNEKICRESTESEWLRLVANVKRSKITYSKTNGWKASNGCLLKCGRPPVCYSFFCDKFKSHFSEIELSLLLIIGNLINYVGERILGGKHLIVLDNLNKLRDNHLKKIQSRIVSMNKLFEIFSGLFKHPNLKELDIVTVRSLYPVKKHLGKIGI